MDALALLHRAQEVGLRVEPMGDKLLVRGPKRAEAVVKLLEAHKGEVLAALALGASTSERGDQENVTDNTEARRWRIGSRHGLLTGSMVIVDGGERMARTPRSALAPVAMRRLRRAHW